MASGELSAFFQVLLVRLASDELLNFVRRFQGGVNSELEKWANILRDIKKGFNDAEEKQFTNEDVKNWLDRLRDLAYDAEDILDEFSTESLKRKLTLNKVQNLFKAINPSKPKFNSSMQSRIKSITTRLQTLLPERDELGLQLTSGETSSLTGVPQIPHCSIVVTEPVIYGRDKDKDKILEMVLSDAPSDANLSVIAVVGEQGIGKTTLVREIYNDKAIQEFKFDIKAWVFVSNIYENSVILRSILESITSTPCDLKTSYEVKDDLRKAVDGKKVFVVLDDMWTVGVNREWENLKAPFLTAAPNSKIVVTTRDSSMPTTGIQYHHLKGLLRDDIWPLFMRHAFEGRNIIADQIQRKVVQLCGGLPLAANIIGSLLRYRSNVEWDAILDSNLLKNFGKDRIHEMLYLSYYYLPFHLKRCFAYCAIFPKDYEFEKNELVLLWMGEGIIQQSRNDDRQLEDWGSRCFDDLVLRRIFQQSKRDSSKFIMDYFVHDLAQLVSEETIFRFEGANQHSRRFERIRHFSFSSDGENKFNVLNEVEHLRTFLPVLRRRGNSPSYVSYEVLHDLFLKFKKLRVLSLAGYYITRLPDSIEDLRLLKYLNLTGTMIKRLPKSTSSLFNLQIMILRDCSRLIKLPSKMRNLINLYHLDIRGANYLKEMPLGMLRLTNLRKLSNFILGKGENVSSLKDLKSLESLSGELSISSLENLNDSNDAKEAELCKKSNLEALSLSWVSQFDNLRDKAKEKEVLEMLKPHTNIKMLTITCYGGSSFSSWIGDQLFSKMEVLMLEDCRNCEFLPSLGLLGSLKHLTIKGLSKLKIISSEIHGERLFQSLETLRFENLLEWECWDTNIEEGMNIEIFLHLRELSIVRCPKLSSKFPELLSSLEILLVNKCAELVVPISCFPKLCKLEIDGCKEIACCSTLINCALMECVTISNSALEIYGSNGMLYNELVASPEQGDISSISEFATFLMQEFQKVETLAIGDSQKIKSWRQDGVFQFKKAVQGLNILACHKEVLITANCMSLFSFPTENFPPNTLRYLKIEDSKDLKSLPEEIMNAQLERLNVSHCDSLTFIMRGKLPSSLQRLEISCCKKLRCLVEEEEVDTVSSSTLKHLEIFDCPELTTLSSGFQLLKALVMLKMDDCPKLVSLPDGLHMLDCLNWIYIFNCPTFVSFPKGGLPRNISDISIGGCENLKALPDDMHRLNSLQNLEIHQCPIAEFPVRGFPSSLTSLEIGDQQFYKTLIMWGFNKLTSLTYLYIEGCHNEESFPHKKMRTTLPTSLTHLKISGFKKLKYLSSIQSLTSLERLEIYDCPKIKSLPEVGLPSSLLRLEIDDCPLLTIKCKRDKGKEWPKIAHIPCVVIDENFVYDP